MKSIIISESNEKVKSLLRLYQKREREKEGKFILEGYRIIDQAIRAGVLIDSIYLTPVFADSKEGRSVIMRFNKFHSVILLKEDLLKKIADTENPQGLIAIVEKPVFSLDDMLFNANLILVLDRLQDPGNMGTIIRTALAAGVNGIITIKGSVDIYNLKVIRSTMGAVFSMPVFNLALAEFKELAGKKLQGFDFVATGTSASSYYYQPDYSRPVILMIGNEASGLGDDLYQLADYTVKIPMTNKIDSLNAAIATGIILYRIIEKKGLINLD
jgi:RNA methyltransferase, TrmH family